MGLLRLFLALSVIAGHAQSTVFGFRGIGSGYAVNFFFIISGFYMAMVLNEKYQNVRPLHFYKSRALRLFPTYYVGVVLALLVSSEQIFSFFGNLALSSKIFYLFQNVFILGQDLSYLLCAETVAHVCASSIPMSINPPAWSLSVELCFYLVAPFILKSEKKTLCFVVAGCIYLLLLNGITFPLDGTGFIRPGGMLPFSYYFYPASFIFFGGGALAYHLSKTPVAPHYVIALAVIVALSFTKTIMPSWHLLFISMAIPVLFSYTKHNRVDRFIGELSYPAYILHYPLLKMLQPVKANHPEYFEFISFGTWVAIMSCLLGLAIYWLIEKKINLYRESQTLLEKSTAMARGGSVYAMRFLKVAFVAFPIGVIAHVYASEGRPVPATVDSAFNLTDRNWVNGVHRRSAGFFVKNTLENREKFEVGGTIKFANGDVRKIRQALVSGPYLNVFLEGAVLDGNLVGFPKLLQVVN